MAPTTPKNGRKFPRRSYDHSVSILNGGYFSISRVLDLGEGGLSFSYHEVISERSQIVVCFQVPGGQYVSIRALVLRCEDTASGALRVSIEFTNLEFSQRRLIRSFVASRDSVNLNGRQA